MPQTIWEQRTLAAAIRAHDVRRCAFFDAEIDLAQRPEIVMQSLGLKRNQLANAIGRILVQAVQLGNVLSQDHGPNSKR